MTFTNYVLGTLCTHTKISKIFIVGANKFKYFLQHTTGVNIFTPLLRTGTSTSYYLVHTKKISFEFMKQFITFTIWGATDLVAMQVHWHECVVWGMKLFKIILIGFFRFLKTAKK